MLISSLINRTEFGDQGIVINDGVPEKFVAAKYSSGKVVILMNLHPNSFIVNGCQKFLTFFRMRISDGDNHLFAICSSLIFMICCRIKKHLSCFLVTCLLIIQDEAIFKSCELTSKTWKS